MKVERARQKKKDLADERRNQQKQQTEANKLQQIKDFEDGIKKAHHMISTKKREKREDDLRLALSLKEIRLQKQYNNADAAMVEYK